MMGHTCVLVLGRDWDRESQTSLDYKRPYTEEGYWGGREGEGGTGQTVGSASKGMMDVCISRYTKMPLLLRLPH